MNIAIFGHASKSPFWNDLSNRLIWIAILQPNFIQYCFFRQASQYLRSMDGQNADCDSMLFIFVFYGKHAVISEETGKKASASADGIASPAFEDEIILTNAEPPKNILTYDFGLRETNASSHSPLVAYAQLRILKNMRARSKDFERRRRAKWEDLNIGDKEKREDRKPERRERHDTFPPLWRDSFPMWVLVFKKQLKIYEPYSQPRSYKSSSTHHDRL